MTFELPKLDYSNEALSPIMSQETLELHHGKHHQTYITNLNNFIKDTDMAEMSLEDIIVKSSKDNSKAGIFNNASQHWNHNLFWKCMKPKGGGNIPSKLEKKIVEDFGSVEKFKDQFKQAGITQFGSGWCWLSLNNDKLVVTKTANAANPLIDNLKPILGCDVWEHSYYIDYRNRRPEYLDKFVDNLIDWEFVEISNFLNLINPTVLNETIKPFLRTYPKGEGPFPLLLIVHSSGGADEFTANWLEFMRDQQKPLLDMGIATMYLDNFSARGAKHTYTDQSKASIWSTYIDVFMALEYLSKN